MRLRICGFILEVPPVNFRNLTKVYFYTMHSSLLLEIEPIKMIRTVINITLENVHVEVDGNF